MHSMCGRAYMGGPSRLLWFLIGSGATYFWIKHRDTNSHLFPHCHRHRLQVPSANGDWQQSQNSSSIPQTLSDVPRAINNIPPASSVSPPPLHNAQRYPNWDNSWKWDSDREHVEKISKQAIDAMVDLTESTLQSVMNTADSLKSKLAEHRALREQQQKVIEQQLHEQRNNPPRLV